MDCWAQSFEVEGESSVVEEAGQIAVAWVLQSPVVQIGCWEQMVSAEDMAEVLVQNSDRNSNRRDSSLVGCGDDSQPSNVREGRILDRTTGMCRG